MVIFAVDRDRNREREVLGGGLQVADDVPSRDRVGAEVLRALELLGAQEDAAPDRVLAHDLHARSDEIAPHPLLVASEILLELPEVGARRLGQLSRRARVLVDAPPLLFDVLAILGHPCVEGARTDLILEAVPHGHPLVLVGQGRSRLLESAAELFDAPIELGGVLALALEILDLAQRARDLLFRSAQGAREVFDFGRISAGRQLDLGDARLDGLDPQRGEDGGRAGDEEDPDAGTKLGHDHGGAEVSGPREPG